MKQKDTMHNPWAGLASYEDPAKSTRKLKFCGRDSETFDVSRLIDDNFFVTLYGKSGIGKTSLLNAGVFPALRREQYTPISLRLGMTDVDQSFQDIITQTIERAVLDAGGVIHLIPVVEEETDCSTVNYLWNWFARRRFLTANGQVTFPVVVFDQFEEVFRHSESRTKTEVLLKQLHYLIDDSHAVSDCIVDGEEYTYDFNFRFVLSIREDDLYRLEDSIDNCSLTALKRCRYRLRSLSEQGAREAVLIPGEGLFRPEEQEGIVRTIIGIARNKEDQSISTNLLSLVCNRIFVEFQKKPEADSISQSLVDTFVKGNPFERFYDEATKGFSNKEKSYIEEHLVDSTGRRNSIPESDFLLHVPNGAKLLEGDTRILQRSSVSTDGGNYRIELIHDSFCEPLSKQREKREKRKRVRMFMAAAGVAILFAGIAWVIFQQKKEAEEATWRMMENRARFVATKGQELIEGHDSYTARLLALEILPESLEHPDKPYVVEAERLLRDALIHNDAILRGHTKTVKAVAYSPDGKRIVSGSEDNTVRIWDAATGRQVGEPLTGHRADVLSVAFSPDGKRIVSGSEDYTVRIWDAATGKQVGKTLTGHRADVLSVAFSPDGKRIVSVSRDNTVRIWDVTTGKQIGKPLTGYTNTIYSVAFSPDGKRIVSGSYDGHVCIWNAATGRQIGEPLSGHSFPVYSVAFSPDGKQIVSGSYGTLLIWDVATGEKIGEPLNGHTKPVFAVAFSPDGKWIVSGSEDQTVRIWDAVSGRQAGEPLTGHTYSVYSVAFSPDGKRIVSGSGDNTMRIWDAASDMQVGEPLMEHTIFVESVAFSPDGKWIVSRSWDSVRIWDAASGVQIGKPLAGIYPVAFSPDGKRIVLGSDNSTMRIWDAASGRQVGEPLTGHTDDILSVAFSPDGNRIVSGSDDHTVRIWSAISGWQIGEPLTGHSDGVESVAFSPDGKRIVSGSGDNTVRIWDATTGRQVGTPLTGHSNEILSVAFSPDGKRIVSGSRDNTVRIWDAASGRQIREPLTGHTGRVTSVAFSPDGRRIVSGSGDKTVRIWDVASGRQICEPLTGHTGRVTSVAFSPDGNRIVSGSWDKTVRIWNFPPLQDLIDETRKRFKDRKLTPEERKKYYLE